MSNGKIMPQTEAAQVNTGAQRARYTAYMQHISKLGQKAKADKIGREKAAEMGGTAV